MNNKGIIGVLIAILVLGGLYVVLQHTSQSIDTPAGQPNPDATPPPAPVISQSELQAAWPVLIRDAASPTPMGNPGAKWTVMEIGDFQCPNCGKAEPIVMQVMKDSKNKVKLYFFNYPIPQLHPHAMTAAQASLAAAAQGKFWEMYKLLYANQDELIDSQIEFNARSIPGLNVQQFTDDFTSGKYEATVGHEVDDINQIHGLSSVPSVLVRDPSGKISVYEGAAPTLTNLTYPGIVTLLHEPPWNAKDNPAPNPS